MRQLRGGALPADQRPFDNLAILIPDNAVDQNRR